MALFSRKKPAPVAPVNPFVTAGREVAGANWRDFVDFTTETTVKNPYRVSSRPSNGTINIRGIVQLKKYDGKTIYTNYPDIAADAGDGRVITVIPKSTK